MSELSPEAKRLIAATKAGDNPSSADEARVYKALAAAVAVQGAVASTAAAASAKGGTSALAAAGGSSLGASVGLKVAAAIAVASVATAGGYVAITPAEPTVEQTEQADAATSSAPTQAIPQHIDLEVTRPEIEPETPATDEASAPAIAPQPSAEQRRPRRARAEPSESMEDPLPREVRLLGQVESALRTGSARQALLLLDDYERTFHRGQLRREADVLRIRSLCELGRSHEARGLADRLRASHPGSPLARRLEQTCAGAVQ